MDSKSKNSIRLIEELTQVGIALSVEKDHQKLLELILKKAMELSGADAASLYSCEEGQTLRFEILFNQSLQLHLGGTGKAHELPSLPMYDSEGRPNLHQVVTLVACTGKVVNIADVYQNKEFDFSGTYAWDQRFQYRSQSFLTVPLKNHLGEIIGVLQLLNAKDPKTKAIIPFSKDIQAIAESLASQSAIILTNKALIEAQKQLFDALIQLIANAIDEKSPYTAGHCKRVPVIAKMLADAACRTDRGPLRDFNMSEDEKYELEVAAWLHDCGKITTPEHVVDKASKLETIFDRIQLIDTRFEVLKRDRIIKSLKTALGKNEPKSDPRLDEDLSRLDADRAFIRVCNVGKEQIGEEELQRIDAIAAYPWKNTEGQPQSFLTEDEVKNLKISRGTLSAAERDIISNHAKVTNKLLSSLPYPKHLKMVPTYAGAHHEKMDGTGYPCGLKGEQMPIQSRMIAIADIFEALTAHDRPYKKALSLSQALTIMGKMKLEQHIDADLFDIFLHEKIYLDYAKIYLKPELIDAIHLEKIPGYKPL